MKNPIRYAKFLFTKSEASAQDWIEVGRIKYAKQIEKALNTEMPDEQLLLAYFPALTTTADGTLFSAHRAKNGGHLPEDAVAYFLAQSPFLLITREDGSYIQSVWSRLLSYPNDEVRFCVINNLALPAEILASHLSRLNTKIEDDAKDFVSALQRQRTLRENGYDLEDEIVDLVEAHGLRV